MEEKKLDLNSIIGFVLIFGILIWMMYQNQPSKEQLAAEKAKKEQAATVTSVKVSNTNGSLNKIDTTSANADQIEKLRVLKRLLDLGFRPGRIVPLTIEALKELSAKSNQTAEVTTHSLSMISQEEMDRYLDLLRSHQLRPYPPQAQGLVLAEGDLIKVRSSSTWNQYTRKF